MLGNVQEKINAVEKNHNESVITFKTSIPLVVNTLNKMDIPRNLYDKFDSEFYNDLNVESFNFNLKTFV